MSNHFISSVVKFVFKIIILRISVQSNVSPTVPSSYVRLIQVTTVAGCPPTQSLAHAPCFLVVFLGFYRRLIAASGAEQHKYFPVCACVTVWILFTRLSAFVSQTGNIAKVFIRFFVRATLLFRWLATNCQCNWLIGRLCWTWFRRSFDWFVVDVRGSFEDRNQVNWIVNACQYLLTNDDHQCGRAGLCAQLLSKIATAVVFRCRCRSCRRSIWFGYHFGFWPWSVAQTSHSGRSRQTSVGRSLRPVQSHLLSIGQHSPAYAKSVSWLRFYLKLSFQPTAVAVCKRPCDALAAHRLQTFGPYPDRMSGEISFNHTMTRFSFNPFFAVFSLLTGLTAHVRACVGCVCVVRSSNAHLLYNLFPFWATHTSPSNGQFRAHLPTL